jgi:hypothetical protein
MFANMKVSKDKTKTGNFLFYICILFDFLLNMHMKLLSGQAKALIFPY